MEMYNYIEFVKRHLSLPVLIMFSIKRVCFEKSYETRLKPSTQ